MKKKGKSSSKGKNKDYKKGYLDALIWIKMVCDLNSRDGSNATNGYKSLCALIEKEENCK